MSSVGSSVQAIYDTNAYLSQNSYKIKLSGENKKITCLRSDWLVSYALNEDENKFIISATMDSRYSFSDEIVLKELKNMEFKLRKAPEKQEFEVIYDETLERPISNVDVYGIINIGSILYYSDNWANEVNFKSASRTHDVVIVFGEVKFYLFKNYLATWSKYFDRMFFGEFKEKDQDEIKIEEVNADEFEQLILLIHPQVHKRLTERNVLQVLKLADRFEIPNLMVRCGARLADFGKEIYETSAYCVHYSAKYKLSGANKKITNLKSEWLVSYVLKEDENKFVISATMASRYSFSDVVSLRIYLEHEGKQLKNKEFKLRKVVEKQEFELQYDETHEPLISKLGVYGIVNTGSITYYSDTWATEVNFKGAVRAHDVVLVVGKSKFYLFKNYLATWSNYFNRMFFGNFKEKDQDEIKLEEVDDGEFEQLIYLIHPQLSTPLNEAYVLKVLKLADRFEIPHLMVRCGVMMSDFEKCKNLSLLDRLELGDKHNLIHLQIACFECIHKMSADERIKFFDENRTRIKELSENTVKNLI